MRRFAAALLLATFVWLPTVANPSPVQAAACTGWSSTTTPPPTIRVLRSGTGAVEVVDFKTYVKVVMPAEWPPEWPIEALRAGAVAAKQYAWYYAIHYRGGVGIGGCYDVTDNTNDQIYSPETRTPAASHISSVETTWSESLLKNGSFIPTGYRAGANVACGADVDGYHLWQASARTCAVAGRTGEQILQIYYNPGMTLQGAPAVLPSGPAATYHALTPARILDTRNGTGGSASPIASLVARTFQVTGAGGVPAGAVAVTGNLTVTQQTMPGYLFLGPVATYNPGSSTLNFPVGDNRANAVTVTLGTGGTLSVTYVGSIAGQTATAHVVFDVTGYFTPDASGSTYHPLTPSRILDSRDGTGGLSGTFTSYVARTFQVTGSGGVPAGAVAVTGNLTVTQQSADGYLFIGPVAQNNPTSSTLNFPVGDNRANAVTVALGTGGALGKLSITYVAGPANATTHVVFDVTGYFTADATGATYVPLNPARILDTRDGTGGLVGKFSSPLARTFQVTGAVPAGAVAVTGNLTVTQQSSAGYLFIGPIATNNPTSSTLNFPVGDNRANAVTVALGTGGCLSITYISSAAGGTTHVVFDVSGYFTPGSS
jgi:hypothetical protein